MPYIIIPKGCVLEGQRRKVRCRCSDKKLWGELLDSDDRKMLFFTSGKYDCRCPKCNSYYFYVE
jgi:hypothetical protein